MKTFDEACAYFLEAILQPDHQFADSLAFVREWFEVQPTAFDNNGLMNSADDNQGSCQLLALALYLKLDAAQCLLCFGEHYRNLADYPANSHLNIRNIVQYGLQQVAFAQFPLTRKR